MVISVKPIKELTNEEYRACLYTNFGIWGLMQRQLEIADEGYAIMLWDKPDSTKRVNLIGWALMTPVTLNGAIAATRYTKRMSKYTVQVYVKTKYRRKGHGKTLMLEATKIDPRPHVIPHDAKSAELFSSFKVTTLRDDRYLLRNKPKVA